MLICPPCDDKPATGTNTLASIHVFNDFHRNGCDIKGLHVKVKKIGTDVYGVRRPCQNGAKQSRGRLAPPCSTNMVCTRNKAVMYL